MAVPRIARFRAKHTNPLIGCHVWTAANNGSYAKFWDGTRLVSAHRWIWEYENGPIPDGMEIDHKCRNTLCVRVQHLQVVTPLKNKHLTRQPTCGRGHSESWRTSYRGWRYCQQCRTENEARRRRGRTVRRYKVFPRTRA